jgi:hypothetical protein
VVTPSTTSGTSLAGSPAAEVVAPDDGVHTDKEHPLTKAGLRFVRVVEEVELSLKQNRSAELENIPNFLTSSGLMAHARLRRAEGLP